jgi:hypothetical protein
VPVPAVRDEDLRRLLPLQQGDQEWGRAGHQKVSHTKVGWSRVHSKCCGANEMSWNFSPLRSQLLKGGREYRVDSQGRNSHNFASTHTKFHEQIGKHFFTTYVKFHVFSPLRIQNFFKSLEKFKNWFRVFFCLKSWKNFKDLSSTWEWSGFVYHCFYFIRK